MLSALLVLFTGCSKDFLDLNPVATPTEVSFYQNSAAIDETVTAAYAELCAREVFDKDYFMVVGSIPSDDVDCGGQNLTDYPIAQHYDQFIGNLSDATVTEEIWRYCYKGLRSANTVLEEIPLVKKNYPDKITDAFISLRTGEMEFLRAWYHFTLVQVFGGVPIADHVIQPSDFHNPRNTIKEVFTFIEHDLKDAMTRLPGTLASSDIGRATKGAAQALLARMLMYESGYAENYPGDDRFKGCLVRYQEAYNYASDLVDNGPYHLVGPSDINNSDPIHYWRLNMKPNDGYRWLFTVAGNNSPEGIFEIQNVEDKLGYGIFRGNVMTVYQSCRWYTNAKGVRSDAAGWSFNSPTQYLVDAFNSQDARETNLHSDPGHGTDDTRFATTIARPGDSLYIHNVLYPMDLFNLPTHMLGRKFECGWDEFWKDEGTSSGWGDSPYHIRLIRLGEIVLLASEAAIKLGDQANALKYINQIRTRARNCGNTGFPKDLTAVSFEDIVHERRLELTCEPHRFFDLVRWGLAYKYLNGASVDAGQFTIDFVKGKYEFWPIPLSEVQLSKGGLVQYQAWQ